MFLTEDGGFPLMASLGGSSGKRNNNNKKKDFMLLANERGTILISMNGVRKGVPLCRKCFINNVKCRASRQNVAL